MNGKLTPWGETLEQLRVRKGLSKGDLVRALGMERGQYYRICIRAKQGPCLSMLQRLLRALDISWSEWGLQFDRVLRRGR